MVVQCLVAMVSSNNEDSNITSLWYKHLGPAVGVVSMYMHGHGKGQWKVVKWILRYLLKIIDVGLVFECDDTCDQYAIGFVNSNCAGDLDKRRSTTDYVFTLSRPLIS